MAIPPIALTIKKLTSSFTLCIQQLPPFTLIHTLPHYNPSADWHLSHNPPTALTCILPNFFPPFYFPSHPSTPSWSHPQVHDYTAVKITRDTQDATKTIISMPPYDTFHLFVRILTSTPSLFTGSFLLFKGQTLVHSGTSCSHSRPQALFSALLEGLTYDFLSNHIRVFLPDLSIANHIFRTLKHGLLSSSCLFIDRISLFLNSHDTHHIDLHRYSIKWSGLPGTVVLDNLKEQAQHIIFPCPPTPLLHLPDGRPPPFYIGALSCMDCATSSASIQLACGHGFTADYSDIFRTNAGDNTLCPCNFINEVQDLAPASTQHPKARDPAPASPSPAFDCLMQQFLDPTSPTSPTSPQAHLPHHQHQQPRPRRLFRNTMGHVLFQCPLHNSPCLHIFGLHANEAYIFGTEC